MKRIVITGIFTLMFFSLIFYSCINLYNMKVEEEAKIKSKSEVDVFENPYKPIRLNEHDLMLVSKTDTITLLLENTYQFVEEVVYIKK